MAETPDRDQGSELARLLQGLTGPSADPDDPEERLAYDGSNEPQQRPLDPEERSLLHRIIAIVADEPRWQGTQIVQKTEIRSVIGDGKVPQLRVLTARERDDLCRLVTLLTSEFEFHQRKPDPYLAYLDSITKGDIARLNLIELNINARECDVDTRVIVHADDWAPPVSVPPGWWIAAAPRPLEGPLTWQDKDYGHGLHYAACPQDQDHDALGWYGDRREFDAWPVITVDDRMITEVVHRFLTQFGCQSAEEAGMTIEQVARDLGLPWREPASATAHHAASRQATRAEAETLQPVPRSTQQLPSEASGLQAGADKARSVADANFPAGLDNPGVAESQRGPAADPSQRSKAQHRRGTQRRQ